jgi:hypothetical protein
MAEYFAAPLPPRAIPIVSKEVLGRGEAIVTHGDQQ